MDKKVLYALTSKIFNTLKKLGIKPKIGVTTGVKRLPGSRNSFNTDLSKLEDGNPEALKKLIANDADFLPQATADEITQYNNNLEYLQSTFPEVFSKPQVVTEAKTGIKTLVDDLNEKLKGKKSMETFDLKTGEIIPVKEPIMTAESKSRKLTKDEIADYEEVIGRNSEEWLSEGTVKEAEEALKRSKAEEAYYYGQYKAGKLDPEPGENSQSRMKFLRSKAEEAEATGDRRLITSDEMDELSDLESIYLKDIDEAYGVDTAIKKQLKDFTSERDMIKQKYGSVIDDNLLQQILIDDNPQRKAEVLATIDEAMKMQEKGMSTQEIIDIMKNTTRTKQAKGGLIKGVSYKNMFNDLDRTLNKGLGTMFKKRKR
jgi:hypothetical protein